MAPETLAFSNQALVGESGSGKKRVIAQLQRFYDPAQIKLLLNVVEIKTFQMKWLRPKKTGGAIIQWWVNEEFNYQAARRVKVEIGLIYSMWFRKHWTGLWLIEPLGWWVVAHRLSTIKNAYVIDLVKNFTVEKGKHESLLAKKDSIPASLVHLHLSVFT
uniref:ABC transporter domain-containing protein n=1 Tax=Brassica oleracea TaxID=3712 RepID=A0A3P6DJ45_BRAOL|nr:unnamed protein product [Brassica oleracea]